MIELTEQQIQARQRPIDYEQQQRAGQDQAWAEVTAGERAEQQRYDRAQQRGQRIELGAAALGLVQTGLRDGNGTTIAYVYEQRRPAQGGLPAGLVEAAQVAARKAGELVRALVAKDRESLQYAAKHNLSQQAAQVHIELQRAELATAAAEADREMIRALHSLGEVVEQITAARATINASAGKLQAIEQQAAALRRQVEEQVEAARQVLLRLGVA